MDELRLILIGYFLQARVDESKNLSHQLFDGRIRLLIPVPTERAEDIHWSLLIDISIVPR